MQKFLKYRVSVLLLLLGGTLLFLPGIDTQVTEVIGVTSASVGLLLIAFQEFRDQLAHEREESLRARQNAFEIGATSHMAITAFDKHVAFSEKYVTALHETLVVLVREGPSHNAFSEAKKLDLLRRDFFIWIPNELNAKLEQFETALRQIGTDAQLVRCEGVGEDFRLATIGRLYETFVAIMGKKFMGADEWNGSKLDPTHAVEYVLAGFRHVLGIEELSRLRTELLKKAFMDLSNRK